MDIALLIPQCIDALNRRNVTLYTAIGVVA